ncbi:Uncharacterised protein [Mycobacterium tuberculosis]|nr:Uncharacterised protein [Mycobacterium tuberculosis]
MTREVPSASLRGQSAALATDIDAMRESSTILGTIMTNSRMRYSRAAHLALRSIMSITQWRKRTRNSADFDCADTVLLAACFFQ